MSNQPEFTITLAFPARGETVAVVREWILGAAVEVSWIPASQ